MSDDDGAVNQSAWCQLYTEGVQVGFFSGGRIVGAFDTSMTQEAAMKALVNICRRDMPNPWRPIDTAPKNLKGETMDTMERPRSRFNEALNVLAGHGMPIFDLMRESGQALPMQVGLWRSLREFCRKQRAAGNPTIHGVVAGHALRKLSRSRRYLHALAAEGAMRHDLEGNPRVPVAEEHRQFAATKLEEARLRAEARRAA